MSHHDPGFARQAGLTTAVRRLLGVAPASSGGRLRADQLARLAEFLDRHDIDICAASLALAQACVGREDLRLVRRVEDRIDRGLPVSREWLLQQDDAEPGPTTEGAISRLADRLQQGLDGLGLASAAAGDASRHYNAALNETQASLVEAPTGPDGIDLDRVMALVHEMVDHAAGLENAMRAAEDRARSLKRDLDKARREAQADHLTGLPNRRAFEERSLKALADLPPNGVATIGFCDIDRFKLVNDTHGHDTGDRVIQLVGRHLAEASGGAECFVARHGGEEFALLFEGCSLGEAHALLDCSRRALAERTLRDRRTRQRVGPVTFSAGLAECSAGTDLADALKSADRAMYRAKREGRDRVCVAG